MFRLLHNIKEEFIFFFKNTDELTKYLMKVNNELYQDIAESKMKLKKAPLLRFLRHLSNLDLEQKLKDKIKIQLNRLENLQKYKSKDYVSYNSVKKLGIVKLLKQSDNGELKANLEKFEQYIEDTKNHIIRDYKEWKNTDLELNFEEQMKGKAKDIKARIKKNYRVDLPIFTITSIFVGLALFYFSGGILGPHAFITLCIISLKNCLPVLVSVTTTYFITSRLLAKDDELRDLKVEFKKKDNLLNDERQVDEQNQVKLSPINNYLKKYVDHINNGPNVGGPSALVSQR